MDQVVECLPSKNAFKFHTNTKKKKKTPKNRRIEFLNPNIVGTLFHQHLRARK
jgi:hypothetical protein